MSRTLQAVVVCLSLSGCSTPAILEPPSPPPIEVTGLVIHNLLTYSVTDVTVLSIATGRFVSCGLIMARTPCATGFPAADYRRNALVVTWKERGVEHSTDEFVVKPPDGMAPGSEATLEVMIHSPGQAGARLVAATP